MNKTDRFQDSTKENRGAKPSATTDGKRVGYPKWLRRELPRPGKRTVVEQLLESRRIHTVCREARCPNRTECFSKGTATFLILGENCTRNCRFCAVGHKNPDLVSVDEPETIAQAAAELALKYVVVTSVTRDDLPDGGAGHFAATITALKKTTPGIRVEVLIPDFQGSGESLQTVLDAGPDVLNHNIETVPRLYTRVRPQAQFERSLDLLAHAKKLASSVRTKSGLMVGLGETFEEVVETMRALRAVECEILTIGQYLQPSSENLPVTEFIMPERFEEYESAAKKLGFRQAFCSPFVRSSYHASDVYSDLPLPRT